MDQSQTPQKRGPKPKQLESFERMGIPVGREGIHVDPDEVLKLAQMGCNLKEISDFFGIHPDTCKRNFADIIQKGLAQGKLSIRRAMMRNATENMVPSVQIFLAKAMLGMSETPAMTDQDKVLPWQESFTEVEPDVQVQIGKTAHLTARAD